MVSVNMKNLEVVSQSLNKAQEAHASTSVNTNHQKYIQAVNSSASSNEVSREPAVKIDTNPAFVMTPDGVTHRKIISNSGEITYTPSVTLDSYNPE